MKKSNMVIAIFAVLAAASVAKADEIKINFDNPGHVSVNAYIEDIGSDIKSVPAPQFVTEAKGAQKRLVLVKDFLKELAIKERLEFMVSVRLLNGKVESSDYAVLGRATAPGLRADEVSRVFSSTSEQSVAQRPSVKLEGLLVGLPENIKEDFIDNLKFLDGNVVSAKTDLLERAVTPDKYEEILNAIMPAKSGGKDIKSITRVKDEACNASTGAKGKAVLRGCDYQMGYTCNPSTCK